MPESYICNDSENYFKLDQFSFNLQYSFRYTLFFTLIKNMNRTEHCQGYQFPGRKINNASRKVHSFLFKKNFYSYFKFEGKCLLLWSLRFNKEISWKWMEGNTPKCKQRLSLSYEIIILCFLEFSIILKNFKLLEKFQEQFNEHSPTLT